MKKLTALALLCILTAFGSEAHAFRTITQRVISDTLDADPTSASSSITKVTSADKIAFFVTYDETEVGGGLSVAVTVDVSWDGTTWLDASFYDYAGGSTLQTSETLSGDGNYYLWFNSDLAVPYVRIVLTATGSDADDTAAVTAYMITQE